jgi:hypothetical protein
MVSFGWALRVVAMIEIMIKRRLTAENLQNNRMIGYALSYASFSQHFISELISDLERIIMQFVMLVSFFIYFRKDNLFVSGRPMIN